MTQAQIIKTLKAIQYREKLAATLPAMKEKVVEHMDTKGTEFLVAGDFRVRKVGEELTIMALPPIDTNQLHLFTEDELKGMENVRRLEAGKSRGRSKLKKAS